MPNTEQSIEQTGGVPEIEQEVEVFGMMQTPVDKTLAVSDMAADAKATGEAIAAVAEDIADLAADVADIQEWTAEDIPMSGSAGAQSVAAAIESMFANLYPVGSLYITAAESLPSSISDIGTWEEVAVPLTWGDIKKGSRNYEETDENFESGNLHMWLRTA